MDGKAGSEKVFYGITTDAFLVLKYQRFGGWGFGLIVPTTASFIPDVMARSLRACDTEVRFLDGFNRWQGNYS